MPSEGLPSSHLPPPPAQLAIGLGFVLGTWLLLDSVNRLITGSFLRWRGLAPSPHAAARLGLPPASLTLWILLFGALWMLLPNLYLFQNRRPAWAAMLGLALASVWYIGWATPLLVAVLILLLLPASRSGFNPPRRPAPETPAPPAPAAPDPARR